MLISVILLAHSNKIVEDATEKQIAVSKEANRLINLSNDMMLQANKLMDQANRLIKEGNETSKRLGMEELALLRKEQARKDREKRTVCVSKTLETIRGFS